ncbi:hypothetical protein SteCoe_18977 [Stentor coeruleus]|uniref:Protein kinase domain-containing protein n=1 Tax=Stentor coeruleus TaxID=5963 RepID=A0A1R2BV91_9CILI|nr:hypothetical protein SteCoe_18977 [Stentor coeruleus]
MESNLDISKGIIREFELKDNYKVTKNHKCINTTIVGSLTLIYSLGTIFIDDDTRNIKDIQAKTIEESEVRDKQEEKNISETISKDEEEKKIEELKEEISSEYIEEKTFNECIIRELKGPTSEIEYAIYNEITFLNSFKDYKFVLKPYGCTVNKEEGQDDMIVYSMISPKPKFNLESYYLAKDYISRLKILSQLLKIMQLLDSKSFCYGNFTPKTIFLDEELNVIIETLIFVRKLPVSQTDLIENSFLLKVAEEAFLAPEVKLGIHTAELYQNVIYYDPMLSDIFSIGLVMLKATCDKTIEYNFLELNEKKIQKLFKKAAGISDLHVYHPECSNNYRNKLQSLIFKHFNQKQFVKILEINPSNRISMQNLASNIYVIEEEINKLVGKKVEQEVLVYQAIKCNSTIKRFIELIKWLEDQDMDFHKHDELMLLKLKKTFDSDNQVLIKNQDAYFEKTFGSEIDLIEGISSFIISFYKFLSIKNDLINFVSAIRVNRKTAMDYFDFFNRFFQIKNETQKDYAISMLQITTNYPKSFHKLFNANSILLDETHIVPVLSFSFFIPEIRKILNWNPIVQFFSTILMISDFESFFNEVFQNTFLVKMFEGLYGCVSSNKRIFVSNFNINLSSGTCSIAQRAALYITLLHEMAHFSRRRDAVTRKEVNQKVTPKNKDANKGDSYYKEGGYQFEHYLFDAIPAYVNNTAGQYFINVANESREEFAKIFKEKNNHDNSSVLIAKGDRSLVILGVCGFRKNIIR